MECDLRLDASAAADVAQFDSAPAERPCNEEAAPRADIDALPAARAVDAGAARGDDLSRIADVQARVAQGERELQARIRSRFDGVLSVRTLVVGVARVPTSGQAPKDGGRT